MNTNEYQADFRLFKSFYCTITFLNGNIKHFIHIKQAFSVFLIKISDEYGFRVIRTTFVQS